MEKRELHYIYGISYLVVIIVGLIAFALFDVENLVDKISFALTITSLVLAVLAIIYTYIAGGKQESQITTLITTNQAITSASTQIQTAANALLGHVAEIPKGLQDLNDKLNTLSTRDLINVSSGKIPEIKDTQEGNPGGSADRTSTAASPSGMNSEEDRLYKFIGKIPYFGMGMIYSFWRACRTDKGILKEWVDENYAGNFMYMLGILYGARGAGFIEFKIRGTEIIPTDCCDAMNRSLTPFLEKVIEVVDEQHKEQLRNYMTLADKEFNLN